MHPFRAPRPQICNPLRCALPTHTHAVQIVSPRRFCRRVHVETEMTKPTLQRCQLLPGRRARRILSQPEGFEKGPPIPPCISKFAPAPIGTGGPEVLEWPLIRVGRRRRHIMMWDSDPLLSFQESPGTGSARGLCGAERESTLGAFLLASNVCTLEFHDGTSKDPVQH